MMIQKPLTYGEIESTQKCTGREYSVEYAPPPLFIEWPTSIVHILNLVKLIQLEFFHMTYKKVFLSCWLLDGLHLEYGPRGGMNNCYIQLIISSGLTVWRPVGAASGPKLALKVSILGASAMEGGSMFQYGPVTMIVPASGYQVRCMPWVQMGAFNKEISFLCGLNFFALNIFCGEYLQSSLDLMLQIWRKPLLWKMCQ